MSAHCDIVVACDGVARTYGRGGAAVVAVHGLSCEVRREDRIALTGPSGSGKSTVLHLMARLVPATTGTVVWPALGDTDRLRPEHIAVVFQGASLVPALSTVENVALPLVIAGRSAAASRDEASSMLTLVGLGSHLDRLPEELSAGQAQRAAIARAMMGTPSLILADEPTGQLDRRTADSVLDALLERADATGAALVIATHDARIAHRFRTRWTMRDGRLHEDVACSA